MRLSCELFLTKNIDAFFDSDQGSYFKEIGQLDSLDFYRALRLSHDKAIIQNLPPGPYLAKRVPTRIHA